MLRERPVVWTRDPKSNMDNLLFKVNQNSKFGNHQANDHKLMNWQHLEEWRLSSFQGPAIWPWPLTMWPEIHRNVSSPEASTVPSLATFTKTTYLTLTFDHVAWKLIGNICFLKSFIVTSLATFAQRCQEILSVQQFFKTSRLTFDHVTSTSIVVVYYLKEFAVPSLATFHKNGQEILSGNNIFLKYNSLTLTFDIVTHKAKGIIFS